MKANDLILVIRINHVGVISTRMLGEFESGKEKLYAYGDGAVVLNKDETAAIRNIIRSLKARAANMPLTITSSRPKREGIIKRIIGKLLGRTNV